MALGTSRSGLPVLRRFLAEGLLAAILVVSASGCGTLAWKSVPEETLECVAARAPLTVPADVALEGLVAAVEEFAEAASATPPKFEIAAGISSVIIGDKLAGAVDHDGDLGVTTPAMPVLWYEAFDHTLGFDAQLVVRRPPRPLNSLAAGDTFLILRVTFDSYDGNSLDVGGVTVTYGSLDIGSAWLDGKTVFNPLDKKGRIRPFLQYGGGLTSMGKVSRTDTGGATTNNWSSTLSLSFHLGLGLEIRPWKNIGIYVEGGVQDVKKPNLDEGAPAERQAEDLLTYPLRVGVMLAF